MMYLQGLSDWRDRNDVLIITLQEKLKSMDRRTDEYRRVAFQIKRVIQTTDEIGKEIQRVEYEQDKSPGD